MREWLRRTVKRHGDSMNPHCATKAVRSPHDRFRTDPALVPIRPVRLTIVCRAIVAQFIRSRGVAG